MSLARAIRTGDLEALPSRRDEEWRWSDLRGLVRVLPPPSPASDAAPPPGPFAGLAEAETLIVNGRGESQLKLAASERRVIALRLVAAANAGAHATRVSIEAGEGADLTLLESYEAQAVNYLVETDLDFRIGPGARVERIVLAGDGPDAVAVSRATVSLGRASAFSQTVATTGAKRQRLETRIDHPGGGASVRLDGIYLPALQRHCDITTLVTHAGPDGTSGQLVKGVARDQGRGVFQGRIVVAHGADRTDARMGHHGLVLSDRAEIDAKPELEIFADDVVCTHGNTVGALDEDALFYACARGVPEAEARAMLTEAFVFEVVDRIEHEGARETLRRFVARELRGAP